MLQDAKSIQKTCAKYFGSVHPWLPVKSNINTIKYYYFDRTKKLGWCVNAKVNNLKIFLVFIIYTIYVTFMHQ